MRNILTINLGGKLRAILKADGDVNLFFQIVSGNKKIISFIPVFTPVDAFQIYKDLTGKELQKTMRDYIKDLMRERDMTYQYYEFDKGGEG